MKPKLQMYAPSHDQILRWAITILLLLHLGVLLCQNITHFSHAVAEASHAIAEAVKAIQEAFEGAAK